MKYRVQWKHEIVQTWSAVVEANSEQEAIDKISEGDFSEDEVVDENGIRIYDEQAEPEDEDELEVDDEE